MNSRTNWTLLGCAATAAAAGLAAADDASAAIIVKTVPQTANFDGGFDYSVDANDSNELNFTNASENGGADQRYYLKNFNAGETFQYAATPVASDFAGTNLQVRSFADGELIGPTATFSSDGGDADAMNYNNNLAGTPGGGLFPTDGSTSYIGFQFNPTGTQTVYGYIGVQLTTPDTNGTLTVVNSAYDDTGAAIAAGDTGVVPEPTGLALLALGAAGLLRRKHEAA